MRPGQCWAFKGDQGYLVVKLAGAVRPTSFTLEHLPKNLSPTGKIDSAPRNFEVYVSLARFVWLSIHSRWYGCRDWRQSKDPDISLANTSIWIMINLFRTSRFRYVVRCFFVLRWYWGHSLKKFWLHIYSFQNGNSFSQTKLEPEETFPFVELRITSNHGHPEYTCLYRFRVHGQLIRSMAWDVFRHKLRRHL